MNILCLLQSDFLALLPLLHYYFRMVLIQSSVKAPHPVMSVINYPLSPMNGICLQTRCNHVISQPMFRWEILGGCLVSTVKTNDLNWLSGFDVVPELFCSILSLYHIPLYFDCYNMKKNSKFNFFNTLCISVVFLEMGFNSKKILTDYLKFCSFRLN